MSGWMKLALGALCGATAALLVEGWAGPLVGALVFGAVVMALRRVEPSKARRARRDAAVQLPIAADLFAAALRAGAPTQRAALVVGEALGGQVGDRLVMVARALRVGLSPEEAWSMLADIPGAGRMARAAIRSANSGAALTNAFERLADDLREERSALAEAAVRRAAVFAVLPLGLCFLPAFLLTGVVPVVAAVLGRAFFA